MFTWIAFGIISSRILLNLAKEIVEVGLNADYGAI